MKHLFIHTILFLTLISVPGQVTGQTDFPVEIIESDQYLEQIIMITDRKVYASGEPVYFRVYNNSPRQLKEHQWSKVLYVEVLNSLNTRVAQGKYELEPRGASGQVLIPDSVTTGTYFIRAYTKWMRNYPASGYTYLPLIIINPYQSAITELIPQSAANNKQTDRDSLSESGGIAAGQENSILCFPDKKIYAKREKITLKTICLIPV